MPQRPNSEVDMTELTPRQIEVNTKIDSIIAGAVANRLPPFAVKLIDTVLRPYAHALDFAEENQVQPPNACYEAANVMASMIVETIVRMCPRSEGVQAANMAQQFVTELAEAVNAALEANFNFGATQ